MDVHMDVQIDVQIDVQMDVQMDVWLMAELRQWDVIAFDNHENMNENSATDNNASKTALAARAAE